MLTKLIKYEFKATARTLVWIYLAYIVVAVLNIAFNSSLFDADAAGAAIESNSPGLALFAGILLFLFFAGFIVIAIVTFVVIIVRFWRNMMGDEGYLSHTLPVSREQHIVAKLVVAFVWTLVSDLLILGSLLLMFARDGAIGSIREALDAAQAEFGLPLDRWIGLFILMMCVCVLGGILMLYAAMAIGPNLIKNHRIGGSVLAFIIMYIAEQIVMTIALFVGIKTSGMLDAMIESAATGHLVDAEIEVTTTSAAEAGLYSPPEFSAEFSQADIQSIDTLLVTTLIASAVCGVVCWFLTRYFMKRKLNLA